MKIFLSFSSHDLPLVARVRERLIDLGHEILHTGEEIATGQDLKEQIKSSLEVADVFITIITENSIKSNWVVYEFGLFSEYVSQNEGKKLLIPVVIDNVNPPPIFHKILYIKGESDNILAIVESIQIAISRFEGRRFAKEKRAEKLRETLEVSAADYIQETISWLENKETNLKRKADLWYFLGYIALIIGVGIASYITITGLGTKNEWTHILLLTVKAAFIILLLLSASKYSFNLAKTYMNESLKNSDRIHAISFGKFYLQVFGNSIDKGDIKEVFREWNLEKKSGFHELNSNDFDPKLIDIITKTIETVKGNKSS